VADDAPRRRTDQGKSDVAFRVPALVAPPQGMRLGGRKNMNKKKDPGNAGGTCKGNHTFNLF